MVVWLYGCGGRVFFTPSGKIPPHKHRKHLTGRARKIFGGFLGGSVQKHTAGGGKFFFGPFLAYPPSYKLWLYGCMVVGGGFFLTPAPQGGG